MITLLPGPTVRLIVCGNADRGDDGVALAAAATVLPTLPPALGARLEVKRREALLVEDLTDLPFDERLVILDAVSGVEPGEVVVMPLADVAATTRLAARSSHSLPLGLVIELAETVRDQPLDGTFIGLGGHRFGYGMRLSRAARDGMPAFRQAIATELRRLSRIDDEV